MYGDGSRHPFLLDYDSSSACDHGDVLRDQFLSHSLPASVEQ